MTTPEQSSQEQLATNFPIPSGGQKRTFMPELPPMEEVSRRRVTAFLKNDHQGQTYEKSIPRGPRMGNKPAPGETNDQLKKQGS